MRNNDLRAIAKKQVKRAVFEGVGVLRGHKLVFYDHGQRWMGAVASIEKSQDEEVWGCIWLVENSFAAELDKQENGYHRLSVEVVMNGEPLICRTYQYSDPDRQLALPSPHYKHVIVSGAIEHSLPSDYIGKLKAVAHNGYMGPVKLDLQVLKELNNNQKQLGRTSYCKHFMYPNMALERRSGLSCSDVDEDSCKNDLKLLHSKKQQHVSTLHTDLSDS
uniref:gamma-glutamylcyclotransferase n=1 Tax=Parascaris univalens TaxID=6257 RepID=A0A914ZS46_PARUN